MSNADTPRRPGFDVITFTNVYGQFAFGVLSLILIWQTIVKPVIEAQRIDYQTHLKIVEEQNHIVRNLSEMSKLIRDTTENLGIKVPEAQ